MSHLIQTPLNMDIESRISDIQKLSSEAVSRMRKSICIETSNNVDEPSEVSEEVDVVNMPINMDQPILSKLLDNSSSIPRIGKDPFRFSSMFNLELQVANVDKRRRGPFEETPRSSKRFDHNYSFNPAQVEQCRRMPLHPISTIGW